MADQGQSADLLWSSEIELGLLGPVRLANSAGDDFTPRARKTRALLAVLALSKGAATRSRLTHLLWGDRGEEQAKASLRQALYELRELATGGYLTADRESVALGPKHLPSDLSRLHRLIDENNAAGVAEALVSVDCPLLATLDDVTPELDEWLRAERARISSAIVEGSVEVATRASDPRDARRIADQLERIDPLDERVAQLGIRADLAAGDRSAAKRRHTRFKERLKDQLGLEPSAETETLLRQCNSSPESLVEPPPPQQSPPEQTRGHRFKQRAIAATIVIVLLIAAGIAWFALRPSAATATPTVAVLPFDDFGQKNEDYFASGVSDEILNLLGHQRAMKVLGRVSAEQLAGANSLGTARELGIGYVLDGSVRTAGDRVLVIARLTRVSDGAQLWSERYERRIGDIFAVQGDIASAVASRLTRSLVPAVAQTTLPEVYDRYLAARQLTRERREVTLKLAEKLLREAIARDPRYAPAFAELAQVIMLESDHPTSYGSIPVAQARTEAAPFARRAVQLDPNLGDGYAAIGFLSLNLDAKSEPYLRKAVALSPQRPEFHRWHAETLMAGERYEDAIKEYRQAVDIDPLWGLNYDHLIGALYLVGRNDEAKRAAQRFFSLSTDERAKQLLALSVKKLNFDLAGQFRTAQLLDRTYPDERQNKLNLAATLGQLGERRAAANLVPYDAVGTAALNGDWSRLARAADALGYGFWDQSGFWNAASLLVASGHSNALASFYYRDRAQMRSGTIDLHDVAIPEMIVALRNTGHRADADQLFIAMRDYMRRLPKAGLLGEQRSFAEGFIAALTGDRETAIRKLDEWTRRNPLNMSHIPAMALRYDPAFGWLASDPRFPAIEDRIRAAINRERAKVGLAPISQQDWISDPKALLTKN